MYCQYETYKAEVYETYQETSFSIIKTHIFKWELHFKKYSLSEEEKKTFINWLF